MKIESVLMHVKLIVLMMNECFDRSKYKGMKKIYFFISLIVAIGNFKFLIFRGFCKTAYLLLFFINLFGLLPCVLEGGGLFGRAKHEQNFCLKQQRKLGKELSSFFLILIFCEV